LTVILAAMLPLAAFAQKMAAPMAAAEWPQYLGLEGRGINDSKPLPTNWNTETGENILWKTAIPGLANSSPILWGDKVFVTTALMEGKPELEVSLYLRRTQIADWSSQQWRLLALDSRTGEVLWNKPGYEGFPKIKRYPRSTLCNPTPATDGKYIVAIFASNGLICFNMEGKPLWEKDLGPMVGSALFLSSMVNFVVARAPVIRDGRVIVSCVVDTKSVAAGFDLATGDQIWRSDWQEEPLFEPPIVVGDLAFAGYDIGSLKCSDANTGKVKYSESLSSMPQGYMMAPVSDGRHIYIASEIGQVFVVPVADKFSVVAMNPLHEVCMATPAIGDGAIYYRTENHLIAVGTKR
jgi:outer membrane protein assembly factor BamB